MTSLADIAPYVSLTFLFIVGLGLGASTTLDDFRHAARKPKAVGIGFLSQYLFMPVAAYVLTLIFRLPTEVAIGAVLIGCSPGGTTSNLFSYWSLGDVALSITMSFLSTCAAFALMPFWIWLLVKVALGSDAQVAWAEMALSLFLILIPTCVGLLVRMYNTKTKVCGKFIWKWVELIASAFGIIFLIASVVVAILAYGNLFAQFPATAWITAAIMQPLGCSFGFFVSKIVGMHGKEQRTISLETGIQSFSLTIAVVQLSFRGQDVLKYALMFPVGYGFLYLAWSPLIVLFFRYYHAPKDPAENEESEDEEMNVEDLELKESAAPGNEGVEGATQSS